MAETVIETLLIKVDSDTSSADAGLRGLQKTLSKFKSAAYTGSSGTRKLSDSFLSASLKARVATRAFRTAAETLGSWFKESNDYVEALNLFNVAMGDCADAALKYAKTVESVMGIDLKEWLTYQGAFYQLADGYGIASESSEKMSKNLTQLAYDLSSLWNVDVKTAFQKLQSGMSGQIKGLKVWGINVSVAQLRETALAHGIDLATSKMTEAQKATLRYITIMEQTANAQGDLARTIVTPSNALRILNAQFTQAKRAMGQVVSVIAVKVIPWFQALIQIIKEAAQSLANALGYELPEIDYSDVGVDVGAFEDVSDSLGEAADNAKELKKTLLGIDEINRMTDNFSSATAGMGGGYASDFGFDLSQYDYDFLANVKMPDLEPFKRRLNEISRIVGAIGAGIAAWKLTRFLQDLATAGVRAGGLKALLSKAVIPIGVTLAVGGLALAFDGMGDAIKNNLDGFNFAETIFGDLISAGGAAIIGSKLVATIGKIGSTKVAFALAKMGKNLGVSTTGALGAAIGAGVSGIILGVPTYITGIRDALVNGINGLSATLVGAGATAAGAGIGAIIGACGGPIGAGIGALIGLAVGLVTDLTILLVQKWDAIKQFFADWWEGVASAASKCWNAIEEFFSPATEWFSKLFGSIWQTISDVFYNIGVIASGCWQIIKAVWGVVSGWFNEHIVTPVANLFSGLWGEFITGAKNAWEGVKSVFSKVATFFSDTFKKAWQGIVNVFSPVGEIFVNIKNGIVAAFKSVVNGIIKGLNQVVSAPFNGINDALDRIRNVEVVGIKPFTGLRTISVPQIPLLAEGGFPATGQMFIAREAGPEMVGTIGGKSAVVNNEQIIASLEGGVERGLIKAMSAGFGGDITIIIQTSDGDIIQKIKRANAKAGKILVPVDL